MVTLLSLMSLLPGLERELRILPHLVRAGHVCVDVGAALGTYSIPLALLVGLGGRVVAVEPRRDAARRLTRLASAVRLPHLHVQATALGAAERVGTLTIPQRSRDVSGRSYLSDTAVCDALDERLRPGTSVQVPVTTLDALRDRLAVPIDFVKCDVEGGELDVFAGGSRVLTVDRPTVLCEVEDRHARRYGRCTSAVQQAFHDVDYVELTPDRPWRVSQNRLFVAAERATSIGTSIGWSPVPVATG